MKNILIIDDDDEFASELGDILTDEGYNINKVNDGEKAINLIKNFLFDIILLDYKMPKLNGIELLKYLKNKSINSRVILITGSLNVEKIIEEEQVKSQVSYAINKPFQIDDLLNKIKLCE